ncbi:Urb2/Npa2 family-domain-containing protein [Lactarius quietus]|nr:Urb2/Npa2 family-domain-containing protein [Lactarius quietus]
MYQDSVQSFVRALRAPTDPPRPGDPPKIDIASAAWSATSFCVPRKAEIILEWCLTRLLKDGTRDSGPNPVLDLRYWELLRGICLSVDSENSKMASVGSAWLQPLLNRVPLLPIVLSLLSNSLNQPAQRRDELYLQSSKSLGFLWSLAAPKFALDVLLDCFGAVLRVMATVSGEVSGLFEICGLVTSSLHTALANVQNKKKVSRAFITNHMGVWLNLAAKGWATLPPVCGEMCDVGSELLFNADGLKQILDDPRSNPLFDNIQSHISSSPSHLLSVVPILMAEFINAIKKCRSLLSSGGSFRVDTQSSVAGFFSFCEDILRVPGFPQTQVWRSRLNLLKVVEDESIFSPGGENTAVLLKEEAEASVECLASTDGANIQSVIQCLCVLSRIDHSIVEASTGRILSRLFTIYQSLGGNSFNKPAHEFLSLTLSYHSKTRTLPVHISRLVDSCTVPPPHMSSFPARMSYDELAASPILTTRHLDKLSKAVRAFITPGQTLDMATRVLTMLQDIWERVRDGGNVSPVGRDHHVRKKRRTAGRSEKVKEDVDANVVTFALAARIAGIVLSSLPLHSATKAVQREVQATVKRSLDGFVLQAILTGANATISRSTDGRLDIWAPQVVAAAALRLRYLLHSSVHACYAPGNRSDSEGLLAQVLAVEGLLPEYSVEIFRDLFHHGSHQTVERQQALFEAVLNFLEVHLLVLQSAPQMWSGRSSQLSYDNGGPALAAVALLRLVLNRHLDTVNLFASSVQRRLVNLLHLAHIKPKYEGAESGLSLVTTVHECLHSANFWELENIRLSFFVVQQEKTAFLDSIDVAKIQGNGKKRANNQHAKDQMPEAVKAYTFLLYTPSECLPKSLRGDFLRKAVVLDFLLGSATLDSTYQSLQIVRTFLFRTLNFLGSWEHEANGRYLRRLMTSSVPISAERVTEELVHGYLLASFRAAVQGSTDKLLDAIQICKEQTFEGLLLSREPEAPLRSSTQRLMDIAMTEFSASMFPPDVISHLSTLFEHVLDQLHPILRRLVTSGVLESDEIINYTDTLHLWSCTIAFGKYLHRPKNPSPGLGTQIMQAVSLSFLSRGSEDACILNVCSAILAVLVSELRSYADEEESDARESHLQLIITTYVVLAPSSISESPRVLHFSSGINTSVERHNFHDNMARLLRSLSPSDFSSCLQFIFEALSTGGTELEMMARLIRIASLALHNSPQNTSKTVQAFDKECLDVFVSNGKLSDAHITRSSILIFISELCSKRPASLRLQNVVSIWVLLSRFLAGSKIHDTKTDPVQFHHIVSVLSALVRLRRDLVITTLPHLSNILRQLIFALRSPRPMLGAKQYAIVADSLPAWIDPACALGMEESKELSRLFTSLSAKTLVRVHGPPAETQKPESLARPLSKHVACVLQAYLDALNDPLCVLAPDIRRELQPGLFVLCDILNHHTRDALMVSALDVGGKAAMKGLWREYEKQRYTGKG